MLLKKAALLSRFFISLTAILNLFKYPYPTPEKPIITYIQI
ncbi:hypothetical protein M211_0556 [Acinetobacter lactucae]|nr:hypothetical protein M211_0556 [Acinetobacter lactucae]